MYAAQRIFLVEGNCALLATAEGTADLWDKINYIWHIYCGGRARICDRKTIKEFWSLQAQDNRKPEFIDRCIKISPSVQHTLNRDHWRQLTKSVKVKESKGSHLRLVYTVWHEIFAGTNFREFHGFSNDLQKLDPVKINFCLKNIPRKFALFI